VAKMCHRALVFSRGKLTAEIDRKNINIEEDGPRRLI